MFNPSPPPPPPDPVLMSLLLFYLMSHVGGSEKGTSWFMVVLQDVALRPTWLLTFPNSDEKDRLITTVLSLRRKKTIRFELAFCSSWCGIANLLGYAEQQPVFFFVVFWKRSAFCWGLFKENEGSCALVIFFCRRWFHNFFTLPLLNDDNSCEKRGYVSLAVSVFFFLTEILPPYFCGIWQRLSGCKEWIYVLMTRCYSGS